MRIKMLMKTIWELDGNTLGTNKNNNKFGKSKAKNTFGNKQNKVFSNLLKEILIKRNSKGETSKQP
jgi:hypothetical protein